MIEHWIDTLSAVWEVDTGRGGRVRSYRMVAVSEIPETLDPTAFPVALPASVKLTDVEYSMGGPAYCIWKGMTEFHISPNCSKGELPYVFSYYAKIWRAAALNFKLGGLVEYFVLDKGDTMQLAALQYGDEAEHWGLLVNWTVKEHVESQLTFGTG